MNTKWLNKDVRFPKSFKNVVSIMCLLMVMQVDVLSRVFHKHLVVLVGYCQDKQIVIYEYMPQGSLHDLLYGTYQTPCRSSKYLDSIYKSSVHWHFVNDDLQFLEWISYMRLEVLLIDFENDGVQLKKEIWTGGHDWKLLLMPHKVNHVHLWNIQCIHSSIFCVALVYLNLHPWEAGGLFIGNSNDMRGPLWK